MALLKACSRVLLLLAASEVIHVLRACSDLNLHCIRRLILHHPLTAVGAFTKMANGALGVHDDASKPIFQCFDVEETRAFESYGTRTLSPTLLQLSVQ